MDGRVIPRQERIDAYLSEGRAAAGSGRWLAAAEAWMEAAKLGSLDGADLVSRTAAPQVKRAADTGHVEAQAMLAGIVLDFYDASALPTAVDYATRAAGAGNAQAKRTLGFMYEQGLGVDKDLPRAVDLWRDASAHGDGYAAFNLAGLHAGGIAPLAGEQECLSLLALAAQRGVVEAGALLADRLAAADRDEEALAWILWAAERGFVDAMFAAGCWYRDGIGTRPDVVQAMRWFFTIFDHGSGDGVHEAIQLAKAGATDQQIREAARLAGRPADGEITIQVRDQSSGPAPP
jgi:TPR repeat protein